MGIPRGRRPDLCPVAAVAAWRALLEGVAPPVTGALVRPVNRHGTVAAGRLSDRDLLRQTRHRSIAVVRGFIRQGSIFLDNPVARLL